MKKRSEQKPLYADIADKLIAAIKQGEYPVGSVLPTEKELCEQYTISRHTAREALRQVQLAGMISRKQGSGSTVQAAEPRVKYNQFAHSVNDLLNYGKRTHLKILLSEHIPTNNYISNLLDCPEGSDCIHLHGVRYEPRSGHAICTSEVYRLPHQDEIDSKLEDVSQAIFGLIAELSIEHIARIEQNITATRISNKDAIELDVKKNSPAMRVVRRYFDHQHALLLVSVNTHPGELFTYSTTLFPE